MKRPKKKAADEETGAPLPERGDEKTISPASTTGAGDTTGIDALQVLQIVAAAIALICIIWLILHNILHLV